MPSGTVLGRTESKDRASRRRAQRLIKSAKRGGSIFTGFRKRPSRSKRAKKSISVVCPAELGLYKPKVHTQTVEFILALNEASRRAKQSGCSVHICFRNTRMITASGGIYLLANTDVIISTYPNVKYTCAIPPRLPDTNYKAAVPVVHSVLYQIGFYKLIGVNTPKGAQLPNVGCWYVSSSESADGQFIANAIERLGKTGAEARDLYRSSIEAIANASEHAYSAQFASKRKFVKKKWWLFSAIMDNKALFYICDLGHGIPVTLEHTQPPAILENIKSKLLSMLSKEAQRDFTEDVHKIKMATMVKETRTALSYRGKGGGDLKSYISKHPGSDLNIFSNRGGYVFKNRSLPKHNALDRDQPLANKQLGNNNKQYERGINHKLSINGTVIGWSMPFNAKQDSE